MGLVRLLLAISVALFHGASLFGFPMVYGPDAVTLFFMISGFYMTLVLNTKYSDPLNFWKNRALKIYPVYLTVILLCHLMDPFNFKNLQLKTAAFYIWSNIGIIGSELASLVELRPDGAAHMMSMHGGMTPGAISGFAGLYIGPVWSLSVELLFYAVAPFMVRIDRLYPWRMAAGILVSLTWLTATHLHRLPNWPWNYNLFPPNLMYFLLGSLAYTAFYRWGLARTLNPRPILIFATALLVASIVFYAYVPRPMVLGRQPDTLFIVAPILLATMPCAFELLKNSRLDRYIGNLSYPVYVSHFMMINHWAWKLPALAVLPATVILSLVFYHGLMRPIEALSSPSTHKDSAPAPSATVPAF